MGMPIPKAIQNMPDLAFGLEFVYKAFWELSSCRQTGWGVGFIPWSVIIDYARVYAVQADELDDFVWLIREMDKSFVEYHAPKENSPKKSKSATR